MSINIRMQPKQLQLFGLLRTTGIESATQIGYGGALGGGKSRCIRDAMLARRSEHQRTNGVIIRRVYDDVKKNHIDPFLMEHPELEAGYNQANAEITLPNGSKILFMYAQNWKEVERKFTGIEFFDIFIDQAEQFLEKELLHIKSRSRWPGVTQGICKTAYFFNPGGPGTEYLRRIFFLKKHLEKERPGNFAFIQAYGWDNYEWFRGIDGLSAKQFYGLPSDERFHLFITQTQYGMALDAYPESLRKGYLLGSFDSFAGQYFAGVWDEDRCVIPIDKAQNMIQPWWPKWLGGDWGFAHHSAFVWSATGKLRPDEAFRYFRIITEWPIDVVVIYRELIVSEMAEDDMADQIIESTPGDEQLSDFFFSPDAFSKRREGNTIAEQIGSNLERQGLPYPVSADNDRVGGWRLLYNMFRRTSSWCDREITKEEAQSGPMLVISANCPNVSGSLPLLVRDPDNLEDVLKTETLADDVADGVRYAQKSYLDPRAKRPRAIEALEVYNSTQDPTARSMLMRKFNSDHKVIRRISRR